MITNDFPIKILLNVNHILFSTSDRDYREFDIAEWHVRGGVLIMSYDTFQNIAKKRNEVMYKSLIRPGPDILVCDEGHRLAKNTNQTSKWVNDVRTKFRIVVTGTPISNRLDEIYNLVNFVRPNYFVASKIFNKLFKEPIENGQFINSSPAAVNLMRNRSFVLNTKLKPVLQRMNISVLKLEIGKKHEFALYIQLTDKQVELYTVS